MTPPLVVRCGLGIDDAVYSFVYQDPAEALEDWGLQALFADDLIDSCTIERDGQRLAGLAFCTWERFEKVIGGLG